MRITTKSTRKPGSAIVEVTSMNHFTSSGTITLASTEDIDRFRAQRNIDPQEAQMDIDPLEAQMQLWEELEAHMDIDPQMDIDPMEAQMQLWDAQAMCASNIARREREAFPITQEERERRRAENPEEYARLVNYASTTEIACRAAMDAVLASRGYDANANRLAASTHIAYLRARSAYLRAN
jgi:hypothetical protein